MYAASRGLDVLMINCGKTDKRSIPPGKNTRTDPSSLGFPDLDIPVERLWVHEHLIEGGDRHDLGYRAKIERALVPEQLQIVQTIRSVSEDVHDETAEDPEGLLLVSGSAHLLHLLERWAAIDPVRLSGPNFLGPEVPPCFHVFPVVPDDVGFLEEETHGVG